MRNGLILVSEGASTFDSKTRAGKRLAELMEVDSVLASFACVGLVDRWPGRTGRGREFPAGQAKAQAEYLWRDIPADRKIVLVGKRAAVAFALDHVEYLTWTTVRRSGTRARIVAVVPHPEAYSWWNEPTHSTRAARFLRRISTAARQER